MSIMNISNELSIGVQILSLPISADNRGVFLKAFDNQVQPIHGFKICQVNYVNTVEQFTLRGMHYQVREFAESKLFKVVQGSIQLAWVNISKLSEPFLESSSIVIDKPDTSVLVPRGYATGYLTLEANTTVLYMSDNLYSPAHEAGLHCRDKRMNIQWKCSSPAMSDKDRAWPPI